MSFQIIRSNNSKMKHVDTGLSMNKWICSILAHRFERKAYVPQQHTDLDHLFESMTQEDSDTIDSTVNDCRTIDEELWT